MKCNKLFILLTLMLHHSYVLYCQTPFVSSLDKNTGRPGEILTINGLNFGTSLSTIQVVFGAVRVTPNIISDQHIEVTIPNGAVYDNVGVTNTANGLTGYSKSFFFPKFGSSNILNSSVFDTQVNFTSQAGLYDLSIADFDGDGKLDQVTANENSTSISVYHNTSTGGVISFSIQTLTTSLKTLHVATNDLNGDEKPEIVLSEKNGSRLIVFTNTSSIGTISFSAPQIINFNSGKLSQIVIKDLDLDGKHEILVTDQSLNRLFVLPNQSTLSNFQFGTPITVLLTNLSKMMESISVADLDGDQIPDVVLTEFLSPSGTIFLIKNISTPGNIKFESRIDELVPSTPVTNLKIGDLDGDSKPDLAVTALLTGSVIVYLNRSTTSSIQFLEPEIIPTSPRPWGIDFGDLDGDGKTEIVVASITNNSITVLKNNCSVGKLNFTKHTINTTYMNRHIRVGDIDGDARPDLSFTSIDEGNTIVSKVSVIKNLNCILPTLSPTGPLTVCSSYTPKLTTINSEGSTYEWFRNGIKIIGASLSYYDGSLSGDYTVKLSNSGCAETSSPVSVSVLTNGALNSLLPASVSPVCIGKTLTLDLTNDIGATNYIWIGPESFVATGKSVTRSNFQSSYAGKYEVKAYLGTCLVQKSEVMVDAIEIPNLTVTYQGNDKACEGESKTFSFFPVPSSGFTYQWVEATRGNISNETGVTYQTMNTGNYFVKLTPNNQSNCAAIVTVPKAIEFFKKPNVDFSIPTSACKEEIIKLIDRTVSTGINVQYKWDFGDGTPISTLQNPTHSFLTVNQFTVKLTVGYAGITCESTKTSSINIQNAPTLTITNPMNVYSFCVGDSILLNASTGFNSYLWSNGKKGISVYAKQGGTISVNAETSSCKLITQKSLTTIQPASISPIADPATVQSGSSSQLSAQNLITYSWTPKENGILSNPTISNPIAKPNVTTVFEVKGKDGNGCLAVGTVKVVVIQENALHLLKPSDIFSPNGDGINENWNIQNADAYPQCGVIIYDERGLKVYESKPYLVNWNGTTNSGKTLPTGVYYYIIRCDDTPSEYVAGSINLIR